MIANEHDLNLIRGLSFDPDAKPNYELLKSCLIWPDETPLGLFSNEGREFLSDLWIVRGFIHRAVPEGQWGLDPQYFKDVWAFGLQSVGQWPGFKRMILSDTDKAYLANCLSKPISNL